MGRSDAAGSLDVPITQTARPSSPHLLAIRVYYEDTDFSGMVYHASYLRFLERGRTELLRALGVEQRTALAGETGIALAFAVRRMSIEFLRPARMDDIVTVKTVPDEVRGASVHLTQHISRETELLVTASVTVAAIAEGRARRLPDSLRQSLSGLLAQAPHS